MLIPLSFSVAFLRVGGFHVADPPVVGLHRLLFSLLLNSFFRGVGWQLDVEGVTRRNWARQSHSLLGLGSPPPPATNHRREACSGRVLHAAGWCMFNSGVLQE